MRVAPTSIIFPCMASARALASLVVFVVATGSGCTPAPVAAFEDFYAVTVAGDAAGVRARLCAEARAPLAAVDDAALVAALAVVKVVRRVTPSSSPPGTDGAVDIVVEDAVGATTTARLRPDAAAPRGWCVTGLVGGAPTRADP